MKRAISIVTLSLTLLSVLQAIAADTWTGKCITTMEWGRRCSDCQ
jgi:hypothetical protein